MDNPEPRYPGSSDGIFRISQSSLETYLRCGLRYWYDRERNIPYSTVRMAIGTGTHEGANWDWQTKKRSGRGAPPGEIVERAVEAYKQVLDTHEVADEKYLQSRGIERTRRAARCYALDVAKAYPAHQVLLADEAITTRWGNLELVGRPDVVTHAGLGDLKVGRQWSQTDANKARQLSVYALLHKAKFAKLPQKMWIDAISSTKTRFGYARWWTTREEQHIAAIWRIIQRVKTAIEDGVFLAAPEGAWWCTSKWCPHWHACEAIAQ